MGKSNEDPLAEIFLHMIAHLCSSLHILALFFNSHI
nr:MAG TPA: hypothetical protein [Caudoviricetes sp.]